MISVLANDIDLDDGLDPSTVTIIYAPGHGGDQPSSIRDRRGYQRPTAGYHGTDYFTYRWGTCNVPSASSNTARVDITVNSINSLPDAQADSAFTQQDTPIRVNVLANDSDPDVPPDPLTITGVVDPDPPAGIASTSVIDDNGTPLNPADDRLATRPAQALGDRDPHLHDR